MRIILIVSGFMRKVVSVFQRDGTVEERLSVCKRKIFGGVREDSPCKRQ